MSIFQIEVVIWSIDISWHYRGKLTTMLLIVGPEKDYKQKVLVTRCLAVTLVTSYAHHLRPYCDREM
jgi:hypothetical protein